MWLEDKEKRVEKLAMHELQVQQICQQTEERITSKGANSRVVWGMGNGYKGRPPQVC